MASNESEEEQFEIGRRIMFIDPTRKSRMPRWFSEKVHFSSTEYFALFQNETMVKKYKQWIYPLQVATIPIFVHPGFTHQTPWSKSALPLLSVVAQYACGIESCVNQLGIDSTFCNIYPVDPRPNSGCSGHDQMHRTVAFTLGKKI